jgi:hypothetical protein
MAHGGTQSSAATVHAAYPNWYTRIPQAGDSARIRTRISAVIPVRPLVNAQNATHRANYIKE